MPWRSPSSIPILFLLSVSNFSCTIDAFTHAMLASEMGSKPYLILEIDAHTADAGVQTRLEAFLDIIGNYQEKHHRTGESFTACRLLSEGRIIRSNGEADPPDRSSGHDLFPEFFPIPHPGRDHGLPLARACIPASSCR
jgi:hypothetical protein